MKKMEVRIRKMEKEAAEMMALQVSGKTRP
jgi:hypothetical protein